MICGLHFAGLNLAKSIQDRPEVGIIVEQLNDHYGDDASFELLVFESQMKKFLSGEHKGKDSGRFTYEMSRDGTQVKVVVDWVAADQPGHVYITNLSEESL